MVKEGIVLGHKVSSSGIEVDKAKIEAISKLPYPTECEIRSVLSDTQISYIRVHKRFLQITRQDQLLVKDAPLQLSENALSIHHRFHGSFCPTISIHKTRCKTTPNSMDLAAPRIRFENHDRKVAKYLAVIIFPLKANLGKLTRAVIMGTYSLKEHLNRAISDKNYEPCVLTESYEDAWPKMMKHKFFNNVTADHPGDIMASPPLQGRSSRPGFTGYIFFEMHSVKYLTYGDDPYMGLSIIIRKQINISSLDLRSKVGVGLRPFPPVDARLFLGKLKSRWYGPFTVSKDMKNRAIELYDEEGSEFIVNKQRVKPYQKNLLDTNKDDDVTLDDEGEVT
ncbi:hypothetical protein Tco_0982234 [Tanacetum coccineum]